jgi:L-ribulose-5-phosphate 3-epimerase
MIKCGNWPIGVCSWCLGNDLGQLKVLRERTGLNNVNLGIWNALEDKDTGFINKVHNSELTVDAAAIIFPQEDYSSLKSIRETGGIMPDQQWDDNRRRVLAAIEMTFTLGSKYLLFHFGFFDSIDKETNRKFKDRAMLLADAAHEKNISLLMETGQESAEDLRDVLAELDHPALKVNLDPGNMLLYNKNNPIEAVNILSPWIRQIHAKDALRSLKPDTWGTETAWGDGQIGTHEFLKELVKIGFNGSIIIEREVGENPIEDIESAVRRLQEFKL